MTLIILMIAFACGIFATWLIRSLALKWGIVNHPNKIVATHVKPVAYLGGAGIFLGIGICLLLLQAVNAKDDLYFPGFMGTWGVALGATGFLVFGVMDDLKTYSPLLKLIAQVILATGSVLMGVNMKLTDIPVLDLLLSVGYIVVIVNAVNLTDVCDGLVGGICAVTFFIIALFYPPFLLPGLIIAAVIAGFLVFNIPPASIYLGDAGAHFLGFLLAVLCMQASSAAAAITESFAWLIITPGVMLFELIFLIVMRRKKGLPWWKGSPDHFSLRLQAAGLSRFKTDLIAWAFTAMLVILVCTLPWYGNVVRLVLGIALIMILIVAWRFLGRHEVKPRTA